MFVQKETKQVNLALDLKLQEALQSYRVSFALLPLIAKAQSSTSSSSFYQAIKRVRQLAARASMAQQGSHGSKNKGGKTGAKGKMRVPQHIFKMGGTANNPAGEPICFLLQ